MSEHGDPIGAPRDRERALSAGYLRLLGHTQAEAANAAGVDARTLGRWESCSWWRGIQSEAADRWLAGAVGMARRALLRALEAPDGRLALQVLERIVPELRPLERVGYSGGIAKLNFDAMTDEQLARIRSGEHPYAVLSQTRAVVSGSTVQDNEILQLPPAHEEGSE